MTALDIIDLAVRVLPGLCVAIAALVVRAEHRRAVAQLSAHQRRIRRLTAAHHVLTREVGTP